MTRNNPSWCCDQIEKLIKWYKKRRDESYDIEVECRIYDKVIKELEEILYG